MTLIDDELRDLLERATLGPWILRDDTTCFRVKLGNHNRCSIQIDYGETKYNMPSFGTRAEAEANAALITLTPELAAENLDLRAESARLTAANLTLAADGLRMSRLLDEAREVVRFYAKQSHPMNNGEKARAFMEKTNG